MKEIAIKDSASDVFATPDLAPSNLISGDYYGFRDSNGTVNAQCNDIRNSQTGHSGVI